MCPHPDRRLLPRQRSIYSLAGQSESETDNGNGVTDGEGVVVEGGNRESIVAFRGQ